MEDEKPYIETTVVKTVRGYNARYGDDRICLCGHPYYRHFDTYDNMFPVGCKYCGSDCPEFLEHGSMSRRKPNCLPS